MEGPYTQTETSSSSPQVPLIEQNHTQLSKSLTCLETFLRVFGFCQYSLFSLILSWVCFLLLGVALPVLMIRFSSCNECEKYEVTSFEIEILVFQSLVAAVSLVCVSHNLRKYGVRKFLFVDRCHGHMTQYHDQYVIKINDFFRLLMVWVFPLVTVKTAREVARVIYVHGDSWWESSAILIALIVSWTYLTIVYLSGCALFNLVCNLQVMHFENYGKLLERDLDVSVYIEEHIRLTHYLSKISHRFRIFFILALLLVTASQFVALLQTTSHSGINLINGGDFAVSSMVELVGIVICLHAAAKITSRAQGVASVATKWHALVTSTETSTSNPSNSVLHINYSETDLETADFVPVPTNMQLAAHQSSYFKRQAFVTYLQSNPGGFRVFGWTIDRALINTIFFLEMSLVMFVLGKTITLTSK